MPSSRGLLIYNPRMCKRAHRPPRVLGHGLLALLVVSASNLGCGQGQIDVPEVLAVTDVTTGWLDTGLDDLGRTKLVPTISFRLSNISGDNVRTLQLNGVFRRCLQAPVGQPMPVSEVSPADLAAGTCAGEVQEWGNAFLGRAVGREGLEPGTAAGPFTMESGLGYTGEQARSEILEHRDFVDVKVELFVKHRADSWARLSEHPIDRQLLTQ